MSKNSMCFERLITEVHTIKVHVVTTTDHCVFRKVTIISRSKLGRLYKIIIH